VAVDFNKIIKMTSSDVTREWPACGHVRWGRSNGFKLVLDDTENLFHDVYREKESRIAILGISRTANNIDLVCKLVLHING